MACSARSVSPRHLLLASCALMPASALAQSAPAIVAPAPAIGSLVLYAERVPIGGGDFVEAERGHLFVPMSRAHPNGGVVAVEIRRFRAQRPSDRPPVFRLPGGPGFEGLEGDIDRDFHLDVVEPYTREQDYVVVGQRGIGASRPNTLCPIGPPAIDGGPADFSRACRAYWEERGVDRRGFTAEEAAADVADAAAALGYDRIVLRGTSFGSHWALAVIRHHPGLVSWAMLSGIEGPDQTYDSPTGLLNSLVRVAAAA